MMRLDKNQSNLGFSIIEFLVAMVLFIIVSAILVQVFPHQIRTNKSQEQISVATQLAQGLLDKWSEPAQAFPPSCYPSDCVSKADYPDANFSNYKYLAKSENINPTTLKTPAEGGGVADPNLARVSIFVSFTQSGTTQTVDLYKVVYKR